MRNQPGFIRTTLVGGVLFLVPLVVLAMVAAKAYHLASILVGPVARMFPFETVAGIALAKLLAITAILVFCFLAGLCARTVVAKKIIRWLEANLLSNLPGYGWIKDVGQTIAGVERDEGHKPVLVRNEDTWQIAFLIERIEGGMVAVFIPGAPSPWSGEVFFMPEERIKPLDVPLPEALKCVRRLGLGTGELLRGKL